MKKKIIICCSIVVALLLITGCTIFFLTRNESYSVTMKNLTAGGMVLSEGGETSVEKGKDLKIYICPEEGYEIDKVLINNEAINLADLVYEKNSSKATSKEGVAVYTVKNAKKDYSIEVYYREKVDPTKTSFSITMKTKNEGGSITSEQGMVSGMTTVDKGKNLKIYIAPNSGYEIEKVLVDNKVIDLSVLVYDKTNPNAASSDGVAIYTFKNVDKDHTIEVSFKAKISPNTTTYRVTMRTKTEGGSITSEQGMISGMTSVEKGKNLRIYLCPNEGYTIDKVLVDNKAIDLSTLVYDKTNPNAASSDGVAIYTFRNVSKDYTIDVYFKAKPNPGRSSYTITMSTGNEGGSITSEQGMISGMTSVESGKNLKIYLCPDEGYKIDKVLVDNKAINLSTLVYDKNNPNAASSDGVAIYTFKNVSKDSTIKVYFKTK